MIPTDLAACNTYIVTVPTPIDAHKRPDLTPLIRASETVGRVLKPGDMVIYESTVFPGATEEICVPVLERLSGLKLQQGFLRRLQPRTDQSRRQGAPAAVDLQGDLGLDA